MVPHRDHRLQCPVSRGSACGHRISGSHVGETGGCETHLLACITLLLIVSSSHTCGAQIDTHMPFQSTLQSLISVSLDWNPDATGPQSQGSQGLNDLCPQNSGLEVMCTQEDAVRIGVFGRCLVHERRVLMIWVGVFLRIPKEHTSPCPPGKDPAGRCQM